MNSKPYTMVFYQVQNQDNDYNQNKVQRGSEIDSEQEQEPKLQYPNAFILSVPIQKVTLKLLKERFPWKIIQKLYKVDRTNWKMQFKIKQINQKVNDINVWLTLGDDNQNVPLYSNDNIIFTKINSN